MSPARQRRFRDVVGRFATGVAIVTTEGESGPAGMTTNAVSSLSLEPMLFLVCFDNGARTLPVVRESRRFGVNILGHDQAEIAQAFASKTAHKEKFARVAHRLEQGVPILDDALGWVACALADMFPGGDHVIAVGEVLAMGDAEGEPLLWYRGAYASLR